MNKPFVLPWGTYFTATSPYFLPYIIAALLTMAETVAFRAALARIRFQPILQDAIITQGVTSLSDLCSRRNGSSGSAK
jgi:hypothetical protein